MVSPRPGLYFTGWIRSVFFARGRLSTLRMAIRVMRRSSAGLAAREALPLAGGQSLCNRGGGRIPWGSQGRILALLQDWLATVGPNRGARGGTATNQFLR